MKRSVGFPRVVSSGTNDHAVTSACASFDMMCWARLGVAQTESRSCAHVVCALRVGEGGGVGGRVDGWGEGGWGGGWGIRARRALRRLRFLAVPWRQPCVGGRVGFSIAQLWPKTRVMRAVLCVRLGCGDTWPRAVPDARHLGDASPARTTTPLPLPARYHRSSTSIRASRHRQHARVRSTARHIPPHRTTSPRVHAPRSLPTRC